MVREALTEASAAVFVERAGIAPAARVTDARSIGGGISAFVVRVTTPAGDLILKQPRERFDVDDEWFVSTARVQVEADVGRWLHAGLGPGDARVPVRRAYLARDEVVLFDAAPADWVPWKRELLDGIVNMERAKTAGRLLRRMHALGNRLAEAETFRQDALFRAQRVSPYWETAGQRAPKHAKRLSELSQMFFARQDFVHGDFSPKNLLVGASVKEMWLVDHEVATRGDAAFDVAFLWTHLCLKAVHNPEATDDLHEMGQVFADAYGLTTWPGDESREGRAVSYLGGLLLARVVGKSPVEYLGQEARQRVARAAADMLAAEPGSLADAAALLQHE